MGCAAAASGTVGSRLMAASHSPPLATPSATGRGTDPTARVNVPSAWPDSSVALPGSRVP